MILHEVERRGKGRVVPPIRRQVEHRQRAHERFGLHPPDLLPIGRGGPERAARE